MHDRFSKKRLSAFCGIGRHAGGRGGVCAMLERLEPRLLLSAFNPSNAEQYLMTLANEMRMNPQAQLPALLNSGDSNITTALNYYQVNIPALQQQWAQLTPAAPLAWNSILYGTATAHNQLMAADNTQSHQLPGEPDLGTRVSNAGYDWNNVAENVYAYALDLLYAHAGFAIDWGSGAGTSNGIQTPPGHRDNIMDPTLQEAGISVIYTGNNNPASNQVGPYLVTQDFGSRPDMGNPWLLGVVYNDANPQSLYQLNEGLGGILVSATANGQTFQTTTMSAGGYQLQLAPGTYTETFSGGPLGAPITRQVTIGNSNTEVDVNTSAYSTPPFGHVDVINTSIISGWAYQNNLGPLPSLVRVDIDGHIGTPFAANLPRTDLQSFLGTADHGFSFAMPTLSYGPHLVQVYAFGTAGQAPALLTSTVVFQNDAAPFGHVDVANNLVISGWAFDPEAAGAPVNIRVDIDGAAGVLISANLPRPDLAAAPAIGSPNHGFSYQMPGLTPGPHAVSVYAQDPTTGVFSLLLQGTIYGNNPPIGSIDIANGSVVAGWAADPNTPAASVLVRVDIDGAAGQPFLASNQRGDLANVPGVNSTAHGFSYSLPPLAPGPHTVSVVAVDTQSEALALLGVRTVMVGTPAQAPPVGHVDILSAGQVSGWAYSAADGPNPVQVQLIIDGGAQPAVSANLPRPDLQPFLGSANHGFSIPLSGLSAVPHFVQVLAVDPSTHESTQIAAGWVAAGGPQGHIDVLNNSAIAGWAYDPAAGAQSAFVQISIDGVAGNVFAANGARPDLQQLLGSTQHGFSFTLPALPNGLHTIHVYVVNPVFDENTLIGTVTLGPRPTPFGMVDIFSGSLISGWAFDGFSAAQPVDVRIDIAGTPGELLPANALRNDLLGFLGSPSHGFAFIPYLAPSGLQTVTVNLIDPLTGQVDVLATRQVQF